MSGVILVFVWRLCVFYILLFMQKTAYEMRISDWSSDVCSSVLDDPGRQQPFPAVPAQHRARRPGPGHDRAVADGAVAVHHRTSSGCTAPSLYTASIGVSAVGPSPSTPSGQVPAAISARPRLSPSPSRLSIFRRSRVNDPRLTGPLTHRTTGNP